VEQLTRDTGQHELALNQPMNGQGAHHTHGRTLNTEWMRGLEAVQERSEQWGSIARVLHQEIAVDNCVR
jgi:hypothetical protein